jgi:hypothetical protein
VAEDWTTVTPLETEDPVRPRRRHAVDLVALVPGVLFIVLAVSVMSGVDVPADLFRNGGLLWIVLVGAGVAILVSELRRNRRRTG